MPSQIVSGVPYSSSYTLGIVYCCIKAALLYAAEYF